MTRSNTLPIAAKKSYRDGHVSVRFRLKCSNPLDGASLDGRKDLTTAQARELAAGLIEQADKADAKVAAKAAHEERRRKWREREIAAGRLVVMSRWPA